MSHKPRRKRKVGIHFTPVIWRDRVAAWSWDFIQGLAQCCRCIICLKTGSWPRHLEDVEEMETVLLHQQEDEDQRMKAASHGETGSAER